MGTQPPGQRPQTAPNPGMPNPGAAALPTAATATAPAARKVTAPRPIADVHVDELLQYVVEKNASDLHICVDVPPIVRIDGKLQAMNYEKFNSQVSQRMLYDILHDDQIQKFEENLELDFSYAYQRLARFRVNIYKDRNTVAGAFRLIPAKIPTVAQLGLPLITEDLARKPRGLVLVTGPTGSGKSTTLAAVINLINNEFNRHIITIEDPIEYLHSHRMSIINQRELGQDTLSFPAALRAALREDPDVLLVGEMRDLETMRLAITSAETGHLVLATLHTNSAAETVDRIVDVFPPGQQEQIRVQLSNNLVAVLSQQLLPRANQPGRVAAVEVMLANAAIRNLIRESKAHQMTSIMQTSTAQGMQTMDMALRDLYLKNMITYEEALERAQNPEELKKLLFVGEETEQTRGQRR